MATDPEQQQSTLSEYEEQLYDRSIRLWGLEAQKRLRAANILLVGFKGMNAEICKNLVLAGIRSVTIMDNEVVSPFDLGTHLFITEASIGKNRAEASVERVQALNPLVQIKSETGDIESQPDSFFKQFALICVSNKSLDVLVKLDEKCRSLGVYFMATDSFGLYGYFFSDLHKFIYTKVEEADSEEKKNNENNNNNNNNNEPSAKRLRTETSTTTTTTTTTTSTTTDNTKNGDNKNTENTEKKVTRVEVQFSTLAQALESSWKKGVSRRGREGLPRLYVGLHLLYAVRERNQKKEGEGETERDKIWSEIAQKHNSNTSVLPADFIKSLAENAELNLAPVCAIVGGVAAQEVIKVLSANDVPVNNFFFYDSSDASGVVERVPS